VTQRQAPCEPGLSGAAATALILVTGHLFAGLGVGPGGTYRQVNSSTSMEEVTVPFALPVTCSNPCHLSSDRPTRAG
jgi:hypothetical protein